MTSSPPNNSGASRNKPDFSFPKNQRLTGKKNISELFSNGSFFYLKPFKIYYSRSARNEYFPGRILIAVPKSKLAKATSRNTVKRRIREAYRLNKTILHSRYEGINLYFDKLAFIYLDSGIAGFGEIEDKLKKILKRLAITLEKENDQT